MAASRWVGRTTSRRSSSGRSSCSPSRWTAGGPPASSEPGHRDISTAVTSTSVIDSHVHYWDPAELAYPWLEGIPRLKRRFGPEELANAAVGVPLEGCIFVECNCAPEQAVAEVQAVARQAQRD